MYYFGLLPIKKPFVALEIEAKTLPAPLDGRCQGSIEQNAGIAASP